MNLGWNVDQDRFNEIHSNIPGFLVYAFLTAAILFLKRSIFRKYIFLPLAAYLDVKKQYRAKFCYYCDLLQHHIVSLSIEMYVLYMMRECLAVSGYNAFNECKQHSLGMVLLVWNLNVGYYITVVMNIFSNDNSDANVMLLHDVVTLFLLLLTPASFLTNAGIYIMALHDIGDIFIDLFKLSKYCQCEYLSMLFGAILYPTFIFLRVVVFPIELLRNIKDVDTNEEFSIQIFMWIIFCCHIYWSILIIHSTFATLSGKGVIDPTEQSTDKHHQKNK